MPNKIDISRVTYFTDPKRLDQLNELVALHSSLSPELLMVATGCTYHEGSRILFILFEAYLAEAFLLVYIIDDQEAPVEKRLLSLGLPNIPYIYSDGDKTVFTKDDLFFGFEFDLVSQDIEFEVHLG